MGHRTLTLALVFRALFLDREAFEELRDDDNPFVEGLFLVVLIGVVTALLNLVGQALTWAATPRPDAIRQVALGVIQEQSWWPALAADPAAVTLFQQSWDAIWRTLPGLLGAPALDGAAFNVLVWPLAAVLSWLVYGSLAHLSARLLGGQGSLNGTLGVTALSFTPFLRRGLGFIPFVVIGGVLQTWQLILRYRAVRTAHGLPWPRAITATLLPFAVYLVFWLLIGALAAAMIALFMVGR